IEKNVRFHILRVTDHRLDLFGFVNAFDPDAAVDIIARPQHEFRALAFPDPELAAGQVFVMCAVEAGFQAGQKRHRTSCGLFYSMACTALSLYSYSPGQSIRINYPFERIT